MVRQLETAKGAKILEIGCGTGASTLALKEQGADVTAIDIDKHSIETAKKRLAIYSQTAEFHYLNATDINTLESSYDFIILSASMEHMTTQERILSIRAAYSMVAGGQYIVLMEMPNGLWYTDDHTSRLPFF